jgi:chromosome segregation ATPase
MSDGLKSEISTLERKLKLLLAEHTSLKKELDHYRNENRNLKNQVAENRDVLASFQNKHKISKIVDSMIAEGEDSVQLKEVIDNYIKEIDKCIAHLSEA